MVRLFQGTRPAIERSWQTGKSNYLGETDLGDVFSLFSSHGACQTAITGLALLIKTVLLDWKPPPIVYFFVCMRGVLLSDLSTNENSAGVTDVFNASYCGVSVLLQLYMSPTVSCFQDLILLNTSLYLLVSTFASF
ncbi:hypothetical protein FGO68_gene7053 [Halteria grandinella]|uniref:Uncharacterized protein n=1 Tax=Halteria grandinella TaxID=5974 RepID=A0A8J8NRA6_HALGN|nr:hypothetical protein FGO68_gene7053 [Halteria grandinella]